MALIPAAAALASLWVPLGDGRVAKPPAERPGPSLDLSAFPAAPPSVPTPLLFIHHSTGGQLLAPEGKDDGPHAIYASHPNGGNLRALLKAQSYEVHELAYDSKLGHKTDLFDWLPKFRDHMAELLVTDHQDQRYADGRRNRVVLFKSCFPNSDFVGEGSPPGNPNGPELNVWNAKATLSAMLPEFQKHPDVLFVYFTAPPLAPRLHAQQAWRRLANAVRGRESPAERHWRAAELARHFNNWVRAPEGWLKDYPLKNVVAFDYYDVLTDAGRNNLLEFPTADGYDSHPAAEGQRRAAEAFVPFLNRAVQRAGLAGSRGEAAAAPPREGELAETQKNAGAAAAEP